MDDTALLLARTSELYARASPAPAPSDNRPPVYKAIGISLAIASGLFIGTSFVLKKTGLLKANVKYNEEAGEGYGYLKNAYWWTGMTLMIIGEICNFVAYAFVDAILVTPLGALSVVITTILSAIFLKERLSFVGKIGCFQCIIGSVVIVMNAPAQSSAANIQEMRHYVAAPGFLVYASIIIIGCAFVAFWVGPRYGKKSMLVYLTICSLIGGLSVVSTQGLGAAIVAQASGTPQFNQWFLYVLFVFVITTLVTEIIFLNVSTLALLERLFSNFFGLTRKRSTFSTPPSSPQPITSTSRAQPLSLHPSSFKASKERRHLLSQSCSDFSSFVPGLSYFSSPNLRKMCQTHRFSKATLIKSGQSLSKKSQNRSPRPMPSVERQLSCDEYRKRARSQS